MQDNQQNQIILIEDLGNIYPKSTSKKKRRYGKYLCYCGNKFVTQMDSVKSGDTSSCGCYQKFKLSELKSTHKQSQNILYPTWQGMMRRCYSEKHTSYKGYGGRGIKVCDEWKFVEKFIQDMGDSYGEGFTLDRIDNNKGYSKDNCRWSSPSTQTRNTRILSSHNSSGYRGVSLHKKTGKWEASIHIANKKKYIGTFNTKELAALAYNEYIIINNLEHTKNML